MTLRLSAPVDVTAMVDVEDGHCLCFVVDLVEDAVLAATSCQCAGELLPKGFPYASRLVEEVAGDEVHDSRCNGFGQSLRDLTSGRSRDEQCVPGLVTAWHARTAWRLARGLAPR